MNRTPKRPVAPNEVQLVRPDATVLRGLHWPGTVGAESVGRSGDGPSAGEPGAGGPGAGGPGAGGPGAGGPGAGGPGAGGPGAGGPGAGGPEAGEPGAGGEAAGGPDVVEAGIAGRHAVVVHGLGEHAARQRNVAGFLALRGFDVVAFDHRGHGRSDGRRGALRRDDDLVDDLGAVVDSTGPAPVLLVGHSMGGLVALRYALAHPGRVRALVLSSPALDPGLNIVQKALLALMSRIAPDVALGNGLDASKISHDVDVVRAYRDDPLVHDRVTARLVRFIVDGARDALDRAATLAVPTLLLAAGDDRLVATAGSRRLAQQAPAGRIEARFYEGLWHELFNESEPARSRVFADLGAWLDAHAIRPA